jgi:hypothetical protein
MLTIADFIKFLEDDGLGHYFDTFWFAEQWVKTWPMIHRRDLCTLGDNTTNRIERYLIIIVFCMSLIWVFHPFLKSIYHLTIKKVLGKNGGKFNVVLQTLLDIATSRFFDRDMKELERQIRFPCTKLSPNLQELCRCLTPWSWELVSKQSDKPITSYQLTVVCFSYD